MNVTVSAIPYHFGKPGWCGYLERPWEIIMAMSSRGAFMSSAEERAYRQGIKDAEDIFHRMSCECTGPYAFEKWWGRYWDVRKEMQMAASRGYRVSLLRERQGANGKGMR